MHLKVGQTESASWQIVKLPSWVPPVCQLISGVLAARHLMPHWQLLLLATAQCASASCKRHAPTQRVYVLTTFRLNGAPPGAHSNAIASTPRKGAKRQKSQVESFISRRTGSASVAPCHKSGITKNGCNACTAAKRRAMLPMPNLSHTTTNFEGCFNPSQSPPPRAAPTRKKRPDTAPYLTPTRGKLWQYRRTIAQGLMLIAQQITSHMALLQQAPLCLLHTPHHIKPRSRTSFSKADEACQTLSGPL